MESNVFKKLGDVRVKLQTKDIKKSGENKFAKFKYYELADFLPVVNQLFHDIGLLSVFNLTSEKATLTIYDTETKDTITFESHVTEAQLGGNNANPIQKLGATHTYMKRYLFLNALEIVEADQVDAQPPQPEKIDHVAQLKESTLKRLGNEKGYDLLNKTAKALGYDLYDKIDKQKVSSEKLYATIKDEYNKIKNAEEPEGV